MSACFIVIGTGRSGTSLAMQALCALGISLDDDLVPPDENNLISTGESRIVRDAMVNLNMSLGRVNGFRPSGWQECSPTQETLHWLTGYLEDQAAKAGDHGFAIKFPLASMFMPLWQRAAADAGIDLRFIWATRQAPGTIQSLIAAYGTAPKIARLRYIQRCYYILRDAPDDTLLLPYEGWNDDPDGQVAALAKVVGIEDPDRLAAARAAFSKSLDHSRKAPNMDLPAAISALAEKLRGQRGPLGRIFDRDAPEHLGLMTKLADLLAELRPSSPLGHADEEHEMRLRLISKLAVTSSKESPEMNEQIDILTQRIRDVNAENRKLKQAKSPPAAQTVSHGDIQRSQEVNSALVRQLTDTLAALRETQGDLQAARERVIAVEHSNAEALDEMRQQAGKLQAELAKTDMQREALQGQVEALRAERDRLAAQTDTQQQALDDLKRQVADEADKLRQSEEARHAAQAEFDATTATLIQDSTEKDRTLEALREERDALAAQTDTQQQALATAEEKIAAGKEAYARLTVARDALEEEIESRVRLKLQDLESREARHRLDAQNLRNTNKKQKNQIDTQKQWLAQRDKKIETLESTLHSAQDALATQKTAQSAAESRAEEAQSKLDALAAEKKAVAEHLAAAQDALNDRIRDIAALGKEVDQKARQVSQEKDRRQEDTAALGRLLEETQRKLTETKTALKHKTTELHQEHQEHQRQQILAQLSETKIQLNSALETPFSFRRHQRARNKINEDMRLISDSGLFDGDWYLKTYPDVAQAKADPLRHFVRSGAYELRDPGPNFSSLKYHLSNPDVTAAGMAALMHYVRSGKSEGREVLNVTEN